MNIKTLENLLIQSWIRETSSEPKDWTEERPSIGQCAVTALIVNDFFGGKIIRVPIISGSKMTSHYYNQLPDGETIDLTKNQFGSKVEFGLPTYQTRNHVLSNPGTKRRYLDLSTILLLNKANQNL